MYTGWILVAAWGVRSTGAFEEQLLQITSQVIKEETKSQ
jgi:hypothetical protein